MSLSKKQRVVEFGKRLLVNAAMNAMPGSVQLLISAAQDFHELFLAAPEEERQALIEGVQSMSEAELSLARAELARETGLEDEQAASVVLESLRGLRVGRSDEREVLRSVNATLSAATRGEATITPQRRRGLSPSAVGTLLGEQGRALELSGREGWPTVEGFELKGVLGRGAAGTVFLAKEQASGRVCALKVGELESESRFEREVRAMGAVEHPNLIDLWGHGRLGTPPPRYWISMPNVGGLTLSDVWRRGLPLDERLKLMGQVLSGLVALHQNNMVHRDLKPANALVTPLLEVRLADFGLSKEAVRGAEATMTATSMGLEGTPAYMSPEQVNEQREVGAEVDVWSFGVMLYEAIKGSRPFEGQNLMRLGMEILTKQLDLVSGIPQELQPVLVRSLSREVGGAEGRYKSALELEAPYWAGARVVIERVVHDRLRPAWERAKAERLFFMVASLEAMSGEGWQAELTAHAQAEVLEGFREVAVWRSALTDAQQETQRAQEAHERFTIEKLQRYALLAQRALSSTGELEGQWRAWHEGLSELEREEAGLLSQVAEARYRASALPSLEAALNEALTAYGRAPFAEASQAKQRALALYQDQASMLPQEARAQGARAMSSVAVGGAREASLERAQREGEARGQREAQAWLEGLRRRLEADEAGLRGKLNARAGQVSQALSAWSRVADEGGDSHDRAASVWRASLESGQLAELCLWLALHPTPELKREALGRVPELSAVSLKRLAEVCSLGVQEGAAAAERWVRAESAYRVFEVAQREGGAWLSDAQAHVLAGLEGVARLSAIGSALGFEQGARAVLAGVSVSAPSWSRAEREGVTQVLRSALSSDLRALYGLVRERKARARRRWVLLGSVALGVGLLAGGYVVYGLIEEAEQRAAAERVEAERRAAAERAEAERRAAAERAEAERRAAAELKKLGLEFIKIPAGSFEMGSNDGDSDERPVHRVRVGSFLMSKTEVTVGQYRKCVEAGRCSKPDTGRYCNWGKLDREDHPINCVDWGQARMFAKWVGADVDLPSEAEWEYAARGGQSYKYAGSNNVDEVGWYSSNSGDSTHSVGKKKANGFGLYDMSGNVWEWTLDEWHNSYSGAPSDGRAWGDVSTCRQGCDKSSARRVSRGGSWRYGADRLRVAIRDYNSSDGRYDFLGFRLRRTIP